MKRLLIASTLLLIFNLICSAGSAEPISHESISAEGTVVAHLEIPRLHISVDVLEGSDQSVLAVAAGHIEGTSLPGRSGNVGIAAHRDTYFGSLVRIRPNDIITVSTIKGNFTYAVHATEIVAPTDVGVLHQTMDSELTLVTCYPFHYKGPSPKRFIVHATSVRSDNSPQLIAPATVGQ